jgi:protein gp37
VSGTSTIEWTDATWNPVTGCTKVSEGCDHCYAETFAERWRGIPGHPYEQGFDLKLWPERLEMPLRWRKPRRVFVNSMSDLFHDGVPANYIDRVFNVMHQTPQHTYQILTKRPGRMASYIRDIMVVLPNVWLGTSVESQKWADVRIPKLLETPAAVRFLSCEPLLGPVDLTEWLDPPDPDADCETCGQEWWARMDGHPVLDEENGDTGDWCPGPMRRHSGIDWIIVGGESGPNYRPMDRKWAESLFGQAQAGRVAFFVKQDSGPRPGKQGRLPEYLWTRKELPHA